ncbi:MAG: hypothetical protein WAS72_00945 [Saprospiraceae bacterium]
MQKSKLIALLKTFSSSELREFQDFISSPFYNKNEELLPLYTYLKKQAPDFDDKRLERAVVYKRVFKKDLNNEKHYHYVVSFLLKLAEQYIGLKEYATQAAMPQCHIVAAYMKRDLEKHYHYALSQAESLLEKQPLRNADYHFQQYLLADVANSQFLRQRVHKLDSKLQLAADSFDTYYISQKLKYIGEMLDRQKSVSAKYSIQLLGELKTYLADRDFTATPSINIYYHLLLTLTTPDSVTHFFNLKKLVEQHTHQLSDEENKRLYSHLLNYTIQKIREGENSFLEECLQLYKRGIATQMLYENGILSHWTYKNMVKLGLRLEQFDWVEQFILEYNTHLKDDLRQNALDFNLAEYYYYKRDLDNALTHLNRVEFTDVFYTLDAKTMLAKIFYETEAQDTLQALIASFKIYLKRNPFISKNAQAPYQNFLKLLTQLAKRDKHQKKELLDEINNTKFLAERSWLSECTAALR